MQLFHFHCCVLCAKRYINVLQDEHKAEPLCSAMKCHLRLLQTSTTTASQGSGWFASSSQRLYRWCIALTCLQHLLSLWYPALGLVLAEMVNRKKLLTVAQIKALLKVPEPVLRGHIHTADVLLSAALDAMQTLTAVSHKVSGQPCARMVFWQRGAPPASAASATSASKTNSGKTRCAGFSCQMSF